MKLIDRNAIDALLTGTTHFFSMEPGEAAVYYESPTNAHMRLPDGTVKHGVWTITSTGYHVDWAGGPSADWQIKKQAGNIVYLNAEDVELASVSRIVPGDAAGLAG